MWKLETSLSLVRDSQYAKVEHAVDLLKNNMDLGFKDLSLFQEAAEACQEHSRFINSFQKLVVIGLGGSSLGTKALCDSLFQHQWKDKLIFLDNIDGFAVDYFLKQIENPEEIGWILCSKSGSTIEVLSLYEYCYNYFKEQLNFSIVEQTAVVTEFKESPLYNFAKEKKIPLLKVPENVGGRFSVFTPIGLLPLQFLKFNVESARRGFKSVLQDTELVCQLTYILYLSQQQKRTSFYSFQYSNQLTQWSLWLQQLWSESLSKSINREGQEAPLISTFVPCRGASDQHSVLQQIVEGRESKVVGFHRVKSAEKSVAIIKECLFEGSLMKDKGLGRLMAVELLATEEAVRESGALTFTLTTEELNEESMSYLMGLWMLSVGALGEVLNINAFNQPGVESGKKITRQSLGKKRQ